jgi:hypothetical protein
MKQKPKWRIIMKSINILRAMALITAACAATPLLAEEYEVQIQTKYYQGVNSNNNNIRFIGVSESSKDI